jgi:hypothetical protein
MTYPQKDRGAYPTRNGGFENWAPRQVARNTNADIVWPVIELYRSLTEHSGELKERKLTIPR